MKTLIRGALLIDPAQMREGIFDVLVQDDKIAKVQGELQDKADVILDAGGLMLLPGLIDIHVHLREPGYEYKETIETGCNAAVRGGFTSICCMPNTKPVLDHASVVAFVMDKASKALCRVHPIGAISKGLLGKELSEIGGLKNAGCVAVSDDGKPVRDPALIRTALEYCKAFDMPIASHCEELALVGDGVMNEGAVSTLLGLKGIPGTAEEVMVARDVLLCEHQGGRLHLCHISTKGSVEIVRAAKARGVRVTAETCPHYFCADERFVLGYDTNAKMNPPLRAQEDVRAIIEGLKDGTIDAIATDHAPHHRDEKDVEFALASNGIVGLETSFALGYTHLVQKGHITLSRLVELMTCGPAKVFSLVGGTLKEGSAADFTLVSKEKYTVNAAEFASKGRNTPFDGQELCGKIKATYVNGKKVYEEGQHAD